jgi:hypothetical protein
LWEFSAGGGFRRRDGFELPELLEVSDELPCASTLAKTSAGLHAGYGTPSIRCTEILPGNAAVSVAFVSNQG